MHFLKGHSESGMATAETLPKECPKAKTTSWWEPLSDNLLAQLDVITSNETEAEILTGIKVETTDDAEKAARALRNRGGRVRHPHAGFSYDMRILAEGPIGLTVTYWGGETGNRVFDIMVDGKKMAI